VTHNLNEQSPQNVQVSANDTIVLELDETPATGYHWEITDINKKDIELIDEEYQLYKQAGIGGGGKKIFKFRVVNKVGGHILLENRQKWSGDVYKRFELSYS
jgi:Predicted secreted protein